MRNPGARGSCVPDHRERIERQKREFVLAQSEARAKPRESSLLPPEKTIEKLKVPNHLKLVRNQAGSKASRAGSSVASASTSIAATSSVQAAAASSVAQAVSLVAYGDSDSEDSAVEDDAAACDAADEGTSSPAEPELLCDTPA